MKSSDANPLSDIYIFFLNEHFICRFSNFPLVIFIKVIKVNGLKWAIKVK